jgi:hypothetical protein
MSPKNLNHIRNVSTFVLLCKDFFWQIRAHPDSEVGDFFISNCFLNEKLWKICKNTRGNSKMPGEKII